MNYSSHASELESRGYTILPCPFTPTQLSTLRSAAHRSAARARAGHWPYVRTQPKQFPPWSTPDPETGDFGPGVTGIWGVQHLMHPDLAERDIWAEVYFGDEILDVVRELFSHGAAREHVDQDDMLVMELFNMLVTPSHDFALRWHRDDISFSLSPAEESEALGLRELPELVASKGVGAVKDSGAPSASNKVMKKRKAYHAQYNLPLYRDSSLHVVPGSHMRPRTSAEAEVLARDLYANDLPGWIAVELNPGDVVFYDNDIIHRGVYRAEIERLTLHGSVGDARGGTKRARNVLQHGVNDWLERCDFERLGQSSLAIYRSGSDNDPRKIERARRMKNRLVAMGTSESMADYSHDD